MQLLLIAFAAGAGLLNTIQTGTNATLNKSLGAPVWAAAAVGTATFLTTVLAALAVMLFAG
jgi:transporter family-2 protein